MTDPTVGGEHRTTRRGVLKAAGATSAGAAAATLLSTGAVAEPESPTETDAEPTPSAVGTGGAFPQSVASGDPTPSGAIVWTRLDPELAAFTDDDLFLQVTPAPDRTTPNDAADFAGATTYTVPAPVAAHDYTVSADLDGELDADRFYFYRFVYGDRAASPVGRLRTLPAPDASPDRLSLAVSSCNRYEHGYYGGFARIAEEDVDYHVSLGDFIYEYAGEGSQPGRDIQLPSGKSVAHTLADFRELHRTYRRDDLLQAAMERHTLIHTWDDHEVVNNRWWNDEADAPDTRSHPFGGDIERMRELYASGIAGMLEYLPLRVDYDDPGEDHGPDNTAQDYFRLYRSFKFGDLTELFMTDERLYRSRPPEGPDGERRDIAVPPSRDQDALDRTMLGTEQYRWFLDGGSNPDGLPDTDGVTGTDAQWKLHGNEVLCAALRTAGGGPASVYLNYDAWDGYEAERDLLMGRLARDEVENYVTLTGDMHSYVAGYLKQDYEDPEQSEYVDGERVGVEFMTPGITSDNLGAAGGLPADETEDAIDESVQLQNPHIEWFNSSRWGYTVVDMTRDGLTYTAYEVDRADDSPDADKRLLRAYRVPAGEYELQEFRSPPLDGTVGDLVAASVAGRGTDPDDDGSTTAGADGDGNGIPDPVERASDVDGGA